MEVAPIPVLRPSYLMDQEEFQGDLIEGPANIFYQKVDASRADLQRMQFQFRAPSDNLLASPIMFLRMVLKITCPQVWNQVQAYINVHGVLGPTHAGAEVGHVGIVDADVVTQANYKGQYCPSIAFADADALTSCCTSINFLFNGTSLGLNRTNRWFRDFTKCMISMMRAQRFTSLQAVASTRRIRRELREYSTMGSTTTMEPYGLILELALWQTMVHLPQLWQPLETLAMVSSHSIHRSLDAPRLPESPRILE